MLPPERAFAQGSHEVRRGFNVRKRYFHPFDLLDEARVKAGVTEIFAKYPVVTGLINNAGAWLGRKEVKDLTLADVKHGMDANFYSAFLITQSALKSHRAAGNGKSFSVSFMGATASLSGRKTVATFSLSKGALRTYAQSLAREVGPEGIHVCHVVIDGMLDNERTEALNPGVQADRYIKQVEISKSILAVMNQDKSAWTFELDIRPFNESW